MQTRSALLALCKGNPMVTGRFPSQGSSNMGFGVFFVLSMNKLLNKRVAENLRRYDPYVTTL